MRSCRHQHQHPLKACARKQGSHSQVRDNLETVRRQPDRYFLSDLCDMEHKRSSGFTILIQSDCDIVGIDSCKARRRTMESDGRWPWKVNCVVAEKEKEGQTQPSKVGHFFMSSQNFKTSVLLNAEELPEYWVIIGSPNSR